MSEEYKLTDVKDIGDARSRGGTRGLAATRGIGNIAQVEDPLGVALAIGDESIAFSLDSHQSVAIATGKDGQAKAGPGSAIVLVYRDKYNHIKHVKAGIVGRNGLKPFVWYKLSHKGEFEEVK